MSLSTIKGLNISLKSKAKLNLLSWGFVKEAYGWVKLGVV